MKRRYEVGLALLGFLLGAAVLAGGEEDEALVESLRALQRSAQRVIAGEEPAARWQPAGSSGEELALFAVNDLTVPRVDWVAVPMTIGVVEDDDIPLFGAQAEERLQPYGTIEELMELVRTAVRPDAWEERGMITCVGRTLVVWQRPEILQEVGAFLDRLRVDAHRAASVEARILEVDGPAAGAVAGATGAALDDARIEALTRLVREGAAREVFHGRLLGFLGERVDLWHGTQHALLGDADVEVAQTATTSDPVVEVLNTGGRLSVRAEAVGDDGSVLLDLDLAHVELGHPVRAQETGRNGVLDTPAWQDGGGRVTLVVEGGRWTVASAGTVDGGGVRALLVRAVLVEPEGGVR